MAVSPAQMKRPDVSENVQQILDRRRTTGPQEIASKAHSFAAALAKAQSMDHENKLTGKPGSNVAVVKKDIYKECKASPEFAKEWKATTEHMREAYEAMREQPVLTDGGPKKVHLSPEALEKAMKLAELEKVIGHMEKAGAKPANPTA
ncbi:MAG: hypothetical protein ABIF01_00900 [Candidatus Micrarchaeota archaeon]